MKEELDEGIVHTSMKLRVTEKKGKLIQIAETLIAKETIEGKELEELFDGPVAEVVKDEIPVNQSEGVAGEPLAEPEKSVKEHD